MRRRFVALIYVQICLLFALGCSSTVPEFENLGRTLTGPSFSGKEKITLIVTDTESLIAIQGQCDSRIKSLELKIQDVSEYQSLEEAGAKNIQVNCGQQVFSFELPSLKDLAYWPLEKNISFGVLIRGQTIGGPTLSAEVTVKYDPPGKSGLPGFRITSGGGSSSSSNFEVKSQITGVSKAKAQSTSYRIQ